MSTRTPLHVLFTINLEPPGMRGSPTSPRTWTQSGRSIEGFCTRLLSAGFPPTLFTSVSVAEEQQPLLEEIGRRGAEVALLLHPPQLGDGRFKRPLGQYSRDDQRALLSYALDRFRDLLGQRPQSFRGGHFSASAETCRTLFDLGFRQGSLSEPGRAIGTHAASWEGAPHDPYYVNPEQIGKAGDLPFLEIPVTTDPSGQIARGVPLTLQIDAATIDLLHRPTIEAHLQRMEREQVAFRTLCLYTSNAIDYYSDTDKHTQTLEGLIDLIGGLAEQYEIIPTTIADAHDRYRAQRRRSEG